MDDAAAAPWPMDIEQLLSPSSGAEGFFVVILADTAEGKEAAAVLERAGGVPSDDLKLYTSDDTLRIHEQYVERRSTVAKVVGAMMDDDAGRDLHLGYAEEGRSALWHAFRTRRTFRRSYVSSADCDYLHARYYGEDGVRDFHLP